MHVFYYPKYCLILGSKEVQRVTNHPVHVKDHFGNLSPTALIPFCEFGGKMSVMGVKIDQFDVPVCNSFRPKIIEDQLCYTIDPNEYRKYLDINHKIGVTLYINYNEDRKFSSNYPTLVEEDNFIIIDTIGNVYFSVAIAT